MAFLQIRKGERKTRPALGQGKKRDPGNEGELHVSTKGLSMILVKTSRKFESQEYISSVAKKKSTEKHAKQIQEGWDLRSV